MCSRTYIYTRVCLHRRAAGERLLARDPRARRINPFVRAAWGAAGRTNEKKKGTKPSPSPVRLTGGVRAAGVGCSACIYTEGDLKT